MRVQARTFASTGFRPDHRCRRHVDECRKDDDTRRDRARFADGWIAGCRWVTGTGAGGDIYLFSDCGAETAMDFTDFGFASTYLLDHAVIRSLMINLVAELGATEPDVIVLEVADGIAQRETAALIRDPIFASYVDRVVFAAGEALGAVVGCASLRALGIQVAAVSGRLTMSPLALREASAALDLPVYTIGELADPSIYHVLLSDLYIARGTA